MNSSLPFSPPGLPSHLTEDHAVGTIEKESVAQFEIGSHKNFVYLILNWETKNAAIVDPQHDLSLPLDSIQKYGFTLSAILLTHSHSDHTAGVLELTRLYPQIPIFIHRDELHRLSHSIMNYGNIRLIRDGEVIEIGSYRVKVLHTPGHSSGECCFFLPAQRNYLFTGDTVFIQDCGRTDLPSGNNQEMFQSLQRLKKLPPDSIILPGHHYRMPCASTLEKEMTDSPPFQCKSVAELEALP
jgi:hydroxyacylglutathione hydrolase